MRRGMREGQRATARGRERLRRLSPCRAIEGGGLGLGWLFQRGASPGKGWLAWQFHRRGQGLGGESKGFGSGRVGVLFFESWRCSRVREGLAWRGKARARGGPRASVPGGVGGRGTGPRDGANFAVVSNAYKRRRMPSGVGVPTGAGLVDGG